MHPELAAAHVKSWENQQVREDTRQALLRHIVAMAGGMKRKSGRQLTIDDFLPDHCKAKRPKKKLEDQESYLKTAFAEFYKPPNGQK